MSSPTAHSLLSPSNAHRWLLCTAAPRYEAQFEAGSSKYAEEGTLAHAICELYADRRFHKTATRKFNAALKKLQADDNYKPEMLATAEAYVDYLVEKANTFSAMPIVALEQKVQLTDWIPDGFGSCDCIMIGDHTLHITDYKHGQGVVVDARENPQMRLYALGALNLYRPIYGDTIQTISMGIVQPRVSDTASEDSLSVEDLLAWGEEVKAKARVAYDGQGEFCPGEKQCRFCRARYQCPARAAQNTALEEFREYATPDKAGEPTNPEARKLLGMLPILTNAQIGDLLVRGAALVSWYNDIKEYAQKALLEGEAIPGWKLVEGRSDRAFTDSDKAFEMLKQAGYGDETLYETKPRTLAGIEKLVGKKRFGELLAELITKPRGKPTLAAESDKREVYDSAKRDFEGIANA